MTPIRKRNNRPRRFCPRVEQLEDRSVPSAVRAGFDATTFLPNDDGTFPAHGLGSGTPSGTPVAQPIGFTINFFGKMHSTAFINNNGNITLDSPLATFTPFGLTSTAREIIAPFFADVDTRFAGSPVQFGPGTVDGHVAFGVSWRNVDYFASSPSHTNRDTFQLILIDRSDTGAGNFDIEFNYDQVQWETGEASGGNASGLGGSSARVGFSNGTGQQGTFFELSGSGIPGSFLDSNLATGLIHHSLNSSVLGRYDFFGRGGEISTGVTLSLSHTVFFPYRPNFVRPSNHVLGWVLITNQGADFTGSFTVSFSEPNVTMRPENATVPVQAIGTTNGRPSITLSGGMRHGQTVAILVDFTYPPWLSLDGIRNALNVLGTSP
jgi:hypothetical protein